MRVNPEAGKSVINFLKKSLAKDIIKAKGLEPC